MTLLSYAPPLYALAYSTDMCIFTLKNIIKYYTEQNSPVFTCFLYASKAFGRVNHWTLFRKLIDRMVPLQIVRLFIFWYQRQRVCIKWGECMYFQVIFTISNGVRQGGILAPILFSILLFSTLTNFLSSSCRVIMVVTLETNTPTILCTLMICVLWPLQR